MLLDNIKAPNDIKEIKREDYSLLAEEIREFLIEKFPNAAGIWHQIWEWWSLLWRFISLLLCQKIKSSGMLDISPILIKY